MKAKSLRNTATYQKLWGGVPSTILLYHGGGYDFACTSDGKVGKIVVGFV